MHKRQDLKPVYRTSPIPYYSTEWVSLAGVEEAPKKVSFKNIGDQGENLSIAFLSMNRSSLSIRLIESVIKNIPDFAGEIIIGDNNSEESEKEKIRAFLQHCPFETRLIEFDQNYGVAEGRNRLFREAQKDWILSLDNDIYFIGNPLIQAQRDIAFLGCHFLVMPLLNKDDMDTGIYGGNLNFESVDGSIAIRFGSSLLCTGAKTNENNDGFLCTALPGGTSIINKSDFYATDGFDSNMFVGFEDSEYSLRLFQKGYKIGCCGMISLVHDHPKPNQTQDIDYEKIRFSTEKIYESAMYFEKKHDLRIWSDNVLEWIELRQRETGSETDKTECITVPEKKVRVALVIDKPGWAFDHIASQLIKHLSHMFEFKLIYTTDIYNIANVFLLTEDCQIIQIFWRGFLAGYWSAYTQERINRLGLTEEEFHSRYIKGKIITTVVYDHLCLEGNEWILTKQLFSDDNTLVTAYATANKKLDKLYRQMGELRIKPVAILSDGVDLQLFRPINLERLDSIAKRIIRFGWAGNSEWTAVDDLKGIHTIIRPAIEALQKKGYNIELVTSDRQDRWIPHEKMPEFYANLDCYLCASLYEGTPNPVLESMACGIPVISTDVGLIPELFGQEQNAFILKERSVDCMMERIEYLLNHLDEFKVLSRENLERIKAWSWEKQVIPFKDFWNAMLSNCNLP